MDQEQQATTTAPTAAPEARRRRTLWIVLVAGVALVAFAVRLAIMERGGGLHGYGSYDDGVYYATADALVHGRLPYRDFLLIQPPLIAVVTAPFAALGTLVGDPRGYEIARLAYMALGAANAVLCAWILRRFGWTAAVVGGLGYAVFFPAVYSERSVLLEPLGTFAVLLAILLLQRASAHPRLAVLAGIVAGLGVGAKIWYLVPALVLILLARGVRLRYLIGVAIGGCAIYLPFLASAPQQMVQQVVLDQLGRPGGETPDTWVRLLEILGAQSTVGIPLAVMGVALLVLAAAAIVAALATRGARTFGVLALVLVAVLLVTPSWYGHYTALTAPPLALCIGVGAQRLGALLPPRRPRVVLAAVLVLGIVGANEAHDRSPVGTKTPQGVAHAAAVVPGCVTADDPAALIEMDVLSRDLTDPTCTVWPDVTGWTYTPGIAAVTADDVAVPRPENPKWQRLVLRFLESGHATVLIRQSEKATGLSPASAARIRSGAVLFHDRRFVVHATR